MGKRLGLIHGRGRRRCRNVEKEMRELKKDQHQQDNQHRVNRRRRNLPAELKVQIVDCLPVENAVHFLANVPNRLIIHHCAPRIRRILKMIGQIAANYGRTLPAPDSNGRLLLHNWQYTPEMDIFLRYGAAHCNEFVIYRGIDDRHGFVGYPADFFNNLIKHYYETKVTAKTVRILNIGLPWEYPAPWPAAILEMKLIEKVPSVWKRMYILRNKHNPDIVFNLLIYFEGKCWWSCYHEMSQFVMWRVDDVQCGEA